MSEGYQEPEEKPTRSMTRGKFNILIQNCSDNYKTD